MLNRVRGGGDWNFRVYTKTYENVLRKNIPQKIDNDQSKFTNRRFDRRFRLPYYVRFDRRFRVRPNECRFKQNIYKINLTPRHINPCKM